MAQQMLSDSPSLKEIKSYVWSKKKDFLKEKDYVPIIVASVISAATSAVLSRYNPFASPISGNAVIDLLLMAIFFTIAFFAIIFLSLVGIRFVDRSFLFIKVVYKKWKPFRTKHD